MIDAELDALAKGDGAIAEAWPERWRKANDARPWASKRRNNLRRAWKVYRAHQAFVAANPAARCGDCQHMKRVPYRTSADRDANYCELDSDFHGYQITDPASVCTRWEQLRAHLEGTRDD